MRNPPITFLLILLAFSLSAFATGRETGDGGFYLQGIVRDSVTMQALPRASVVAVDGRRSTVCDAKGIFGIHISPSVTAIKVSCMGYQSRVVPVRRDSYNMIVVYLPPETMQLEELTVTNKHKKYSKDNPAVRFVRRLRDARGIADPLRHPYYSYDKYERITLAINDFNPDNDNFLLRHYPFLREYVDTSDVSGKPILNVSLKEKSSTVNYRRHPRSVKTTVLGFKSTGIDGVSETGNTQVYLEDVLREINLYDKDINILQKRFVSPLSPIAPDFYRFYLTDTVAVGADTCVVLSFYPFNKSYNGFTGHLYVARDDSAMTIRRVDISVPREINLNFVREFYLSQTYSTAPDGTRLKMTDDLVLELSPLPGMPSLYVRRNTAYGSHSFSQPADSTIFDHMQREFTVDSVGSRSEQFWEEARLSTISPKERGVGAMLRRLGKSKLFYYGARAVSALVRGYVPLGRYFEYGPLNTTLSFNDTEGTRFRVGGLTTAALSPRWFARGYAAYGTKDHKWKYEGEIEYSFVDKKHHSREFPVRSIRLSHGYDLDHLGQHYLFTNSDNFFLSLKRLEDHNVIYRRKTDLTYTLELYNNFSLTASATARRLEATRWVPFVDGYGNVFHHLNENSLTVSLRYAPGEKFMQTRSKRIPVNLDTPVFTLSHTIAPDRFLGSRFALSRTDISFRKRFWFSAFGCLDALVSGSHVWTRSPWFDLIIPNSNLSYTIQPESFALLNPMEFINDSQVAWFMTYQANGALFNLIPGFRSLRLREVFAFNGFYGRMSHRNLPEANPAMLRFAPGATVTRMDSGPYMEASVGVDNIFSCLRVDYVWRLAYRRPLYNIDRSGVRIAFHLEF